MLELMCLDLVCECAVLLALSELSVQESDGCNLMQPAPIPLKDIFNKCTPKPSTHHASVPLATSTLCEYFDPYGCGQALSLCCCALLSTCRVWEAPLLYVKGHTQGVLAWAAAAEKAGRVLPERGTAVESEGATAGATAGSAAEKRGAMLVQESSATAGEEMRMSGNRVCICVNKTTGRRRCI